MTINLLPQPLHTFRECSWGFWSQSTGLSLLWVQIFLLDPELLQSNFSTTTSRECIKSS